MINIDKCNLMKFIQNQVIYLDDIILNSDNVNIECMHRNRLCWKLSITDKMRKQTIHELKIEFLYDMIHRIYEINDSYIPTANNTVMCDYFKIN